MGNRNFGSASDQPLLPNPHGARLSTEEQFDIQQTLVRYAYALDHADLTEMRDLLAEGASWRIAVVGGDTSDLEGREAILDAVHQATSTLHTQRRHSLTNVRVSEQECGGASAHCYFLLTESTGEAAKLLVTGFYEFALARTPHHWRISRIVVSLDNPTPAA